MIPVLMMPVRSITDDESRDSAQMVGADYVAAFAPHLIDLQWQFMDSMDWIMPLESLLPDQQQALRAIGAVEALALRMIFYTSDQDALRAYSATRTRHFFCVVGCQPESADVEDWTPDFWIETLVVYQEQEA